MQPQCIFCEQREEKRGAYGKRESRRQKRKPPAKENATGKRESRHGVKEEHQAAFFTAVYEPIGLAATNQTQNMQCFYILKHN